MHDTWSAGQTLGWCVTSRVLAGGTKHHVVDDRAHRRTERIFTMPCFRYAIFLRQLLNPPTPISCDFLQLHDRNQSLGVVEPIDAHGVPLRKTKTKRENFSCI